MSTDFNSQNMSSFFSVPFFQFNRHFHNSYNQKPKRNHSVLFREKHIHPRYNLAYNYMVKANKKTS